MVSQYHILGKIVITKYPFQAERVEQPHKLFTGSWHKTTKSKYYGLSKEAFDGQSAFVLVKLPKRRVTVSVGGGSGGGLRLMPNAQRAIDSVQVSHQGCQKLMVLVLTNFHFQLANPNSVRDFLENFGSHYVQDIVVGDNVYQVGNVNRWESLEMILIQLMQNNYTV